MIGGLMLYHCATEVTFTSDRESFAILSKHHITFSLLIYMESAWLNGRAEENVSSSLGIAQIFFSKL